MTVQHKLDMALDDLVDQRPAAYGDRGGRDRGDRDRDRGSRYGPSRDSDGRDGPYGNDRGKGKSKGKARLSLEERAYMKTRCFSDAEGELRVRLYETDVFTLKQRRSPAPEITVESTPAPDASPSGDGGAATATDAEAQAKEKVSAESTPDEKEANAETKTSTETNGEGKAEVLDTDEAPAKEPKSDEAAAQQTPPTPAVAETAAATCPVIVLNSGKFRTVETRFVINESLHLFGIRVTEENGGDWMVNRQESNEKPQTFEDGMELEVREPAPQLGAVRQFLEDQMARARQSRDYRPPRDAPHGHQGNFSRVPPPGHHQRRDSMPGPPQPFHGHGGSPPPGWPAHGPQGYYGYAPPPGSGAAPFGSQPPPASWGAPPAAHHQSRGHSQAAAAAVPRGPLPDNMFQ